MTPYIMHDILIFETSVFLEDLAKESSFLGEARMALSDSAYNYCIKELFSLLVYFMFSKTLLQHCFQKMNYELNATP